MEEELIPSSNLKSAAKKRSIGETLESDWDESVGKAKDTIKKNSLDSDEEDDGEERNYEILDDDDIEGQEEGTCGLDGEVQITPFNMKEELEEGHFDTEGNYHWNKEKLLRDNWLENIDWVKIKQPTGDEKEDSNSDDSDSDIVSTFDHVAVYKLMLEMMRPGETVAKSLRRLGGNKTISASERWRRKKAGQPLDDSSNQQQVTDLTELANRLLTKMGNMDIYQESYEEIAFKVEKSAPPLAVPPATAPPPKSVPEEPVLDMYADDFDLLERRRRAEAERKRLSDAGDSSSTNLEKRPSDVGESSAASRETAKRKAASDGDEGSAAKQTKMDVVSESPPAPKEPESTEIKWEFKWDKTSSEIHGPHTSAEMQGWVDEGYFKEVWVRKCGTEGDFYTSQRIDFELYL